MKNIVSEERSISLLRQLFDQSGRTFLCLKLCSTELSSLASCRKSDRSSGFVGSLGDFILKLESIFLIVLQKNKRKSYQSCINNVLPVGHNHKLHCVLLYNSVLRTDFKNINYII